MSETQNVSPSSSIQEVLAGVEVMLSGVRDIPDHLSQGAALASGITDRFTSKVKRVTLCGLGGSAFPGDLLQVAIADLEIPFAVSRHYEVLAAQLSAEDLVIASSFSGNTEESISALDDALARGAQVMVICAGGQMASAARARDLPLVQLIKPTPTFQPRAATGLFLGVLSALLEDLGFFPGARARLKEVGEALKTLMEVEAEAEEIAEALDGQIPVFYAPPPYAGSLARVVKIKINENAKIPAFWNEVPEFNHNEMVGYTRGHAPLTAVFFIDPNALPRMQTRMRRSLETLTANGVRAISVPIRSAKDPLTALLATLHLFDVVSCKLAIRAGIDPNPVAMVEEFKASLGAFIDKGQP
jgi:glucose/mannose-6-phosphate isomerase